METSVSFLQDVVSPSLTYLTELLEELDAIITSHEAYFESTVTISTLQRSSSHYKLRRLSSMMML